MRSVSPTSFGHDGFRLLRARRVSRHYARLDLSSGDCGWLGDVRVRAVRVGAVRVGGLCQMLRQQSGELAHATPRGREAEAPVILSEAAHDDEPDRDDPDGRQEHHEEDREDAPGPEAVLLLGLDARVYHHRVEEDDHQPTKKGKYRFPFRRVLSNVGTRRWYQLRLSDFRDDVVVVFDIWLVISEDTVRDQAAEEPNGNLRDGPGPEHREAAREEDTTSDLAVGTCHREHTRE